MPGHLKARRLTGVRQEIKFLLDPADGPAIRSAIESRVPTKKFGGFDSSFRISVYLDTTDFVMARRGLVNGTQTTKLRLKKYYQIENRQTIFDPFYWVESKTRSGNMVEKVRFQIPEEEIANVLNDSNWEQDTAVTPEERIARDTLSALRLGQPLIPLFVAHYRRYTYQDEASTLRITLDDACSFHLPPRGIFTPAIPICSRRYLPPPLSTEARWIMEIKSTGLAPSWISELTASAPEADYSKFVTGVHALEHLGMFENKGTQPCL